MATAPDGPATRWVELLGELDMACYYDKLVGAAFDSPGKLITISHDDAMAMLKELEVLPGHRHRLLKACADSTTKGMKKASIYQCSFVASDAFLQLRQRAKPPAMNPSMNPSMNPVMNTDA